MMITECGALGGMRIGRGNRSTPQCHSVHQKSHDLTRDQTQAATVGSQQNVGKTKEISLNL
jgi:hypothetical protein